MESKTDPKAQAEMRAAEAKVAAEALATRVERDRADDRAMAERERLEAERVRIADAETASQRAAMRAPAATHATMPAEHARTKVWVLTPRDVNEPPFHFSNVPLTVVVRAASETEARNQAAAGEVEPHGAAWQDKKLSSCVDAAIGPAGLIARDMGV